MSYQSVVATLVAHLILSCSVSAQSIFDDHSGFYGVYDGAVVFAGNQDRRLPSVLNEFPSNVSHALTLGYRLGTGFDVELQVTQYAKAYELDWLERGRSLSVAPSVRFTHPFGGGFGFWLGATPQIQITRGLLSIRDIGLPLEVYPGSRAVVFSFGEEIGVFQRVGLGGGFVIVPMLEASGALYFVDYQRGSDRERFSPDASHDCARESRCFFAMPSAETEYGGAFGASVAVTRMLASGSQIAVEPGVRFLFANRWRKYHRASHALSLAVRINL